MGALADKELQNVAEGAMTIADLFDQDIKEVTAATGVAMKAFGINGQYSAEQLWSCHLLSFRVGSMTLRETTSFAE